MSQSSSYASSAAIADDAIHMRHRISWGAVFAGLATALVVELLLNMLGIGVGASALSVADPSGNPSASTFSTTAALWWTVSGILASLAGGVVAGRLCGSSSNNTARWHGLVSWAATTLVVFYLMTSAVGGILGGTLNVLGNTLSSAGRGAASAVSGVAGSGGGDALAAQAKRLVSPNDAQSAQDDVVAYIRASVDGDKAAADAARDRAVASLSKAANISPDEARARLQQAEQQATQAAQAAKQKAQQAAKVARKGIATAGFYGFVALLLGAIASWFGGALGAPRELW